MFRVSSHLSSLNIKTPSQTSTEVWLLGDSTSCQVGRLCLVSSVFTLIGGWACTSRCFCYFPLRAKLSGGHQAFTASIFIVSGGQGPGHRETGRPCDRPREIGTLSPTVCRGTKGCLAVWTGLF